VSKRKRAPRVPPMRTLALIPQANARASEKVQLGLRLRNEANLTGRCACGATRETFRVEDDGTIKPVSAIEPGRAYYSRFRHEDDCPAISPELQRAHTRGEINDPGGDFLKGLLSK
jgi:hypothetical protein